MNTYTAISILKGDISNLKHLANCKDPVLAGLYTYLTTDEVTEAFHDFLTEDDLRPSVPLFRPCSLAKESSHLLTIIGSCPLFKYQEWMNPMILKQRSGLSGLYQEYEIDYNLRSKLEGDTFFELLPCPELEMVINDLQKGGLSALKTASAANKAQLYIICKAIRSAFPELCVYLPILERNITVNSAIQVLFKNANYTIEDVATFFESKVDEQIIEYVHLLRDVDFQIFTDLLSQFNSPDFNLNLFIYHVKILAKTISVAEDPDKIAIFINDSIINHHFLKFALQVIIEESYDGYSPDLEAQVYLFYPKNVWIERFILSATFREPYFSIVNQRSSYISYTETDFDNSIIQFARATKTNHSHVSIYPTSKSFFDFYHVEDHFLSPVSFL